MRAGDLDDAPRRSRLEMLPAPLGGISGVDLRTTVPHAPFVLLLGAGINPLDPDGAGPLPSIRVFGAQTIVTVFATDATGRFRVSAPVGTDPLLAGANLLTQALVLTPFGVEATNVAATTVAPAAIAPNYLDISSLVPPEAASNSSGPGAAQDLDGDGDPDLVLITGPQSTIHVYRNDGNFTFTDVTASALPLTSLIEASNVEAFDANGDKLQDLLIIGGPGDPNGSPLPNLLLLNIGNLQFQIAPFPDIAGLVRDIAIADLDSDGDLDLVLANGNDGVHTAEVALPNTLLVNQGGAQNGAIGQFVASATFQTAGWNGPSFNTSVAAGDIDDDGDVDLFFGRSDTQAADGVPGQPNVLLRNDGNLSFTDISASNLQPLYSDNTEGARFGDLDGDGHLDLVVANSMVSIQSANSGTYYRNQGGGVFIEDKLNFPQIDQSETAIRLGVRLCDVDLDGDLDVFMHLHEFFDFDGSTGLPTGGDDLLFVNQGGVQGGTQGTFALDTTFTKGGIFVSSDMILADFDRDGDDDVYIPALGGLLGPYTQDHLLMNLRR